MNIFDIVIITLGLSLFEIVSSFDNAIINGEVLSTMSQRARRWFLVWGILIAVFLIRGLLPLIIVWISNPQFGIIHLFTAAFGNDPTIMKAVEQSAPVLLIGGGMFLILLFIHWLFVEPKEYGIRGEKYLHKYAVWFYAISSIVLLVVVWFALKKDPIMAFSAMIGSTAFFVTHGFKQNAAEMESRMLNSKSGMSDISKLLYLEVIDATFSIDGVLGAFAFTLSVPLILLGNGIGAIVVRQLTIKNIENVKKYKYLKNGAMYSIFGLGSVMVLDSFGLHIPTWFTPLMTFIVIGYFFWLSIHELKKEQALIAKNTKKTIKKK